MPDIDPGHNLIDLVIAVVFLLAILAPSVFALVAAKRAKSVHNDVTSMKADITTNHGKTPAEYLEMVNDVRETQVAMRSSQLEIKELLVAHAETLSDHTQSDAANFAELKRLIEKGPIERSE